MVCNKALALTSDPRAQSIQPTAKDGSNCLSMAGLHTASMDPLHMSLGITKEHI